MNIRIPILSILSILVLFGSCQKENEISTIPGRTNPNLDQWSVPIAEVQNGGPGKDGIPAIDQPEFVPIDLMKDLVNEDLVLVFRIDNEVHIYPHNILDWHEIVNDEIGGKSVAITYCPLTGTASAWSRQLNGAVTTFGVSGLLYNSNLIAYDRLTNSNWSQVRGDCVNGVLLGRIANDYHLLETTWETARKMFPEALVLTRNTGFNRNYTFYPYGAYRENDRLFFPVRNLDKTLQIKERVLGLVSDLRVRVYRFEDFIEPMVIRETFGGKTYIIAGNAAEDYLIAFEISTASDVSYDFIENPSNPSVLIQDSEGNQWDILGRAVAGPKTGTSLIKADAFIGFWFSWAAFHPRVEIFTK
jgi:hypothetical protein